jgi:hypothetical protein
MIFYWINRVIIGDTLFSLAIWAGCIVAYLLTGPARWPKWGKALYFIALSFGLMVLAHYVIDALQNWWVTPIDEPMRIVK